MTNTQDNDLASEDDLFYFETDHLALRGNKDYSEVLKNLLTLCAQRQQAIKDYSKAVELKKEALEDPLKVLEKIVQGEPLGMPDLHTIPELPVIDFSKYEAKVPEDALKEIYSDAKEVRKKVESPKKEPKTSRNNWTTEEQKKLEELLHLYPPEPIEMRRFKKIANALGNKTLQQVTSRVQKYFVKLYKAGLPVPGRIPKSAEKHKRSLLHKHQRHNHYLLKPTTFFPDLCVPVVMDETENAPGPSTQETQPTSSNYLLQSSYNNSNFLQRKTDDELKLELLRRVRRVKVKEEENGPNEYHHIGFKCDYCGEEPILGVRWHCSSCTSDSIDFCTDCVLNQMYSDCPHPFNHCLVAYSDSDISDEDSNGVVTKSNDASSESSDSEFGTEMNDLDNRQIVSNGFSDSFDNSE